MENFDFAPLTVGAMRFGAWGAQFTDKQLTEFIEFCLELGLRDFDHADIYGNYTTEGDFGRVMKQQPGLKEQVKIITKCGIKMMTENRPDHKLKSYDSSAAHIRHSVENSLKQLQIEKIDVLLLHRPDMLMHPQEVANEVEALKAAGKVLHFGVSNYTPSQFDLLHSFTPLVTNQVEISLTNPEAMINGVLDQCMLQKIRPMSWSPLGGGQLFSENLSGNEQTLKQKITELAGNYGVAADQIMLAWLLKHPAAIIPVLGTSRKERIKSAHQALQVDLSREDWYGLLEASRGHEVA